MTSGDESAAERGRVRNAVDAALVYFGLRDDEDKPGPAPGRQPGPDWFFVTAGVIFGGLTGETRDATAGLIAFIVLLPLAVHELRRLSPRFRGTPNAWWFEVLGLPTFAIVIMGAVVPSSGWVGLLGGLIVLQLFAFWRYRRELATA